MVKRLANAVPVEAEPLNTTRDKRRGRMSGVLSIAFSLAGLAAIECIRHPNWLAEFAIHPVSPMLIRAAAYALLLVGFVCAAVALVVHESRTLGTAAIVAVVVAIVVGSSTIETPNDETNVVSLGLDWFALKLLLTGTLFIPLERFFPRRPQVQLRVEWREDLFYFFAASLIVQSLTLLSLAPSKLLVPVAALGGVPEAIAGQPLWLQFLEIMVLADFVQYWLHRLSHRVPLMWYAHAIHHSSRTLDWLVGARNHVLEVIGLRAATIVPFYIAGYSVSVLYAYLAFVYVYATFVHSNVKLDLEWLRHLLVIPRFHHWHHGTEKEAVDVNFAIHFPIYDRLFGTYYLPPKQWPAAYGIKEEVPTGVVRQFIYAFTQPSHR